MRKSIAKFVPLILITIVIISTLIFYGVALSRNNNLGITEIDLSRSANISGASNCKLAFDNNKFTAWTITEKESEVIVDFEKPTQINALVLNEIGFNVKSFSVFYQNAEDWKLCHHQNEIGSNRLATFYTVTTQRIKIVVEELKNMVSISDIGIYNLEARDRAEDLRVTAYITPPSIKKNQIDPACFDVITDVQFIAYGRFDGAGNLGEGKYEDGNSKRADEELQILKDMIGNRDVNILLTIFPPLAPDKMADVFRYNMDNAVDSIVEAVLATNTDGADFDWEYPANAEEYRLYSEFLVKLKTRLSEHGKQLSVALSPWNVKLTKEAINAIDQLQIMSYDLFDHNGDNNSYAGSVESSVKYMLDLGFKPEQINLGISYYGRPSDGRGEWYNYNDKNFIPDEHMMYQKNVWFNTPTTVRDKTVYAILRGIGGIMTFAQDEDLPMNNPLSLTAQIGNAKNTFSRKVGK